MEDNTNINLWAHRALLANGYVPIETPQIIQDTPWSSVSKILTTNGFVYLKLMPLTLSLEPQVTQLLATKFDAPVPNIIAQNQELHCFLMSDCGQPLRSLLKHNFQVDLLKQALGIYTRIQFATANQVYIFLKLGVPDWRLAKLPDLYVQLILQQDFLQQDGMTADDIIRIQGSQHKVSELCEKLAIYNIPETLDHTDFHDNNIVLDSNTKKLSIIDWGETVITHPFFSVLNLREQVQRQHEYDMHDLCIDNWLLTIEKTRLTEALQLAKQLWPVYSALAYYRLTLSTNIEVLRTNPRNIGRITRYLRDFNAI